MSNMEITLGVLSIVGFIAALPQIWGSSWKDIWLFYKKDSISWDTVHQAYLKVVDKLVGQNFTPTVVIGVGRGGIVAAGLVCSEIVTDKLESGLLQSNSAHTPGIRLGTIDSTVYFKPLSPYNVQVQTNNFARVDRIELENINIKLEPNDRVLILVAQTFSGSTLNKAISLVLNTGIARESIKTATLFWHESNSNITLEHEPDLFGAKIKIDKTMPWKSSKISTDRF